MLKKSITYQDLDGNAITEDFYFNLTKAELAEMELSEQGGMRARLMSLIEEDDRKKIIGAFKMLISTTVGRRSDDGKRFIKNEQITNEFMQTEAYSVLFMELMTDTNAVVAFAQGVMPADLVAQVDMAKFIETQPTEKAVQPAITQVELPLASKTLREYTQAELEAMPIQQLHELVANEPGNDLPKQAIVALMKREAE